MLFACLLGCVLSANKALIAPVSAIRNEPFKSKMGGRINVDGGKRIYTSDGETEKKPRKKVYVVVNRLDGELLALLVPYNSLVRVEGKLAEPKDIPVGQTAKIMYDATNDTVLELFSNSDEFERKRIAAKIPKRKSEEWIETEFAAEKKRFDDEKKMVDAKQEQTEADQYKIRKQYDKFDDTTTLMLGSFPVEAGKYRCRMIVSYAIDPKVAVGNMYFAMQAKDSNLEQFHAVRFLLDRTIRFSPKRVIHQIERTGGERSDRIFFELSEADAAKVFTASTIELKIGSQEILLTEEQMKHLNDFHKEASKTLFEVRSGQKK